jgi:hypothetical protein
VRRTLAGMGEREPRLSCAVMAAFAMLLAGCTADDEDPAARQVSPSGPANSQDHSAALRPQDQRHRLEPTNATDVLGQIDEDGGVTRTRNGNTLVVWHPPNDFDVAFYRVYDRSWAPVSDLLELRAGLEVVRGLRSSFLARASVSNRMGTRMLLNEWVVIAQDGQLRRVAQEPGRHDLEARDLRARTPFAHEWAFRPRTGSVIRLKPRPWERTRGFLPYVDDRGAVCIVAPGMHAGEPLYTSLDDGLTWRRVETGATDLSGNGTLRVQQCAVTADRLVVMTGGEYPQYLFVLDRPSGALVSRISLADRSGMGRFSGYGWQLLPDGRLVFDARGPGLLVATDASNQQFVFRPGPVADVVDGDLVDWVPARRFVTVSEDAGRTWSRVDLSLPPD